MIDEQIDLLEGKQLTTRSSDDSFYQQPIPPAGC